MKIDTALNHERRFMGRIREAYRDTLTQVKILDYIKAYVYDDPAWAKCPRHVRESVQGYHRALVEMLWKHELHVVVEHEGVRYTNKWDTLPEKVKGALCAGANLHITTWVKTGVRYS